MTKQEAVTVIEIMTEADNGCPVCAAALIRDFFLERFPEWSTEAEEVYARVFDGLCLNND